MTNLDQKSQQRLAYLRRLYELTDGDENGSVPFAIIRPAVGLDDETGDKIETFLLNDGLIAYPTLGQVGITHQGVLQVERLLRETGKNAPISTGAQDTFEDRFNRISPELIKRLRARRPGYDRVLEILRKYESLGVDERQRLQETNLLEGFVVPLFQALGWAADKVGLQQQAKFRVDLVIDYEDLHIPIEVKRYVNQLNAQAQSDLTEAAVTSQSDFGMLTNFDRIRVFAMHPISSPITGSLQPPDTPLIETSPEAYVTAESTVHDLIAASIFYERVAKRQQKPETFNEDVKDSSDSKVEVASRAVADSPSSTDLLGFTDYANAIADFIKNEHTSKPLTIGIDAPWGMGKTTLMRMVRDRLVAQHGRDKKRRSFPIVWFNAWSFDQEESVWAALTLAILKEVRSNLTLRQRMRLWLILSLQQLRHTDAGLLAMRAFRAACFVLTTIVFAGIVYYIFNTGLIKSLPETIQNLLSIGLAVGGFGFILSIVFAGIQLLNTILKAFDIKVVDLIHEPSDQKRINFLSEFHADFQEIAKLATENGKWPIVVFIDDLERAAPPRPAEIVEAINLFLGSQFTVFVIGMDARMVAGSIEAKYAALKEYLADEDEPGGLRLGQRFLDKIVQVNFRIPRSDSEAFGGFIRRNVSGDDDSSQPLTSDKVTQTEELIRAEQRTGKSLDQAVQVVTTQGRQIDEAVIRKAKQEIFAKSLDDSPEFRDAVNGAARYLGFNPRKFKRFLNNFRLLALIYNRRGLFDRGTHQLTLLANWTIISTRWPDVNDALDADPKFHLLLVDAYKARDIVHQRQDHGESDEIGAYAEKKHLDSYVANRYIKRLIDSDDLKSLLEKMKPQEIELVSQYANYRSITP